MSSTNDFVIENGVLNKYVGLGGDVIIPCGVEKIGFRAFAERDDIDSVVIPEGVTTIADSAFIDCHNLKRVVIPESAVGIESSAFGNCRGLQALVLPESLQRIEGSSFYGCTNLKSIIIPDSVTSVGMMSFACCDCDIFLSARNRDVSAFHFSNCRVHVDMGEWKPEYTKALKNWNIVSLIVDDVMSVPTVHRNAAIFGFVQNAGKYYDAEATKQYESYMKKNAVKLCPFAFDHPEVLHYLCDHQLIKPKDVDCYTAEAEKNEDTELKALMLDYQNKLGKTSITEAKEKKSKKQQKYEDAVAERIMEQDSSKGISGITFAVTGKLKSWSSKDKLKEYLDQYGAVLSSSITKKTDYLVTNDTDSGSGKNKKAKDLGLTVISEEEFNEMIGARFRDAEKVIVPSWLKEIRQAAFYNCSSMKTVIIPEGVERIGYSAFQGCTSLQRVEIPESVTAIETRAFRGCNSLADENGFVIVHNVLYSYVGTETVVNIPSNVQIIDTDAFANCRTILEVVVPGTVKKIGQAAFSFCNNMQKISLPDSVVELGWQLFSGCNRLQTISLPSNIKSIAFAMFNYCESLESVIIPNTVTEIEDSAFEGCSSLRELFIPASVQKIGDDRVFTGCRKLIIHTPAGSYAEQYAKAHKIKVVTE